MDRRRQRDVRRIRTDPDALEAFYREHVDAVQRFVARRVSCPELAADLTADIFVAAVESAGRYRADRGAPSAWLHGIARHVVWAEYRRAGRERSASVIAGSALLDGEDVADISPGSTPRRAPGSCTAPWTRCPSASAPCSSSWPSTSSR